MSKSLRADIHNLPTRATRLAPNLTIALTKLRDAQDLNDGYPTSTLGASDPEGHTVIYQGLCRELAYSDPDNQLGVTRPCGNPRPCRDHDTHVPLTSVERAASNNSHLWSQYDQLVSAWDRLAKAFAHLELLVTPHLPKVDTTAERCNRGSGREGAASCEVRGCACGGWGDPLCENIKAGDRGGLCDACSKRERRYRKAHDLPPRNRDAA